MKNDQQNQTHHCSSTPCIESAMNVTHTNPKSMGTVFWITGLSGAGKTTIGQLFAKKLKLKHLNLIYLDGDQLREVFDTTNQHSQEFRKKQARQYSRMCAMLATQGSYVVCTTISMYQEIRDYNREKIANYKEIYIRVPMETLIQRDQKNLYTKSIKGEINNVMGLDLPFEEPLAPDLVIDNKGNNSPQSIVDDLWKFFNL